jgi:hypothetical protein
MVEGPYKEVQCLLYLVYCLPYSLMRGYALGVYCNFVQCQLSRA